MRFVTARPGDALWARVARFAATVPWFGGPLFAAEMVEKTYLDWERLFVALDGDTIAGFCALTAQDGYPELPYTPYANSLYVDTSYRGRRLGQELLEKVRRYAGACGFDHLYLMTGHRGLYEKYGFEKIDERPSVWEPGTTDAFYRKPTKDEN